MEHKKGLDDTEVEDVADADVDGQHVARVEQHHRAQDDPRVLQLVKLVHRQLCPLAALAVVAGVKKNK